MKEPKREFDLLTKEHKEKLIREIIGWFENERDETIGIIAANEMLEFFQGAIGPTVYNKAVNDAKAVVRQGMESVEIDVDALQKK